MTSPANARKNPKPAASTPKAAMSLLTMSTRAIRAAAASRAWLTASPTTACASEVRHQLRIGVRAQRQRARRERRRQRLLPTLVVQRDERRLRPRQRQWSPRARPPRGTAPRNPPRRRRRRCRRRARPSPPGRRPRAPQPGVPDHQAAPQLLDRLCHPSPLLLSAKSTARAQRDTSGSPNGVNVRSATTIVLIRPARMKRDRDQVQQGEPPDLAAGGGERRRQQHARRRAARRSPRPPRAARAATRAGPRPATPPPPAHSR